MKKKKNHGVTRSFTEEERDFVFPPCISVPSVVKFLRVCAGPAPVGIATYFNGFF
jgi:hypothetical protein